MCAATVCRAPPSANRESSRACRCGEGPRHTGRARFHQAAGLRSRQCSKHRIIGISTFRQARAPSPPQSCPRKSSQSAGTKAVAAPPASRPPPNHLGARAAVLPPGRAAHAICRADCSALSHCVHRNAASSRVFFDHIPQDQIHRRLRLRRRLRKGRHDDALVYLYRTTANAIDATGMGNHIRSFQLHRAVFSQDQTGLAAAQNDFLGGFK